MNVAIREHIRELRDLLQAARDSGSPMISVQARRDRIAALSAIIGDQPDGEHMPDHSVQSTDRVQVGDRMRVDIGIVEQWADREDPVIVVVKEIRTEPDGTKTMVFAVPE